MTDTVMVYADGTVGLRQLPSRCGPDYYEPIPQPFSVSADVAVTPTTPTWNTRHFSCRGHMFDERPILTDDARWADVCVVQMEGLFRLAESMEYALAEVRGTIRRFLSPYDCRVLDERDEWDTHESQLAKRLRVRQIVAMPASCDPRTL